MKDRFFMLIFVLVSVLLVIWAKKQQDIIMVYLLCLNIVFCLYCAFTLKKQVYCFREICFSRIRQNIHSDMRVAIWVVMSNSIRVATPYQILK